MSRERHYNSKRICTTKLKARTTIFFLSNRGRTTYISVICLQSFPEIVLRCVICQGELSKERYYNSKRICTANLRTRTSIFFLSNRGTTCIFEIWVQSFPRSFSVALVAKENWAENAIIIQKGFVLQNWGQGHLFSFCRTGGQHAFLRFASKVFSRSFSFPLVAREYWIFNAGQCFAFLWYH